MKSQDQRERVRDITLQAGPLNLAARVWGEEGGRPVLALHGWLDNAASFDALGAQMEGVHLVALEMAGHGLSQHRPPGSAYHFVDNIPDVLAAADALGWKRFTLLGHSLGAAVASFIAAVAPERIAQLLLIDGLGPPSGEPAEEPERLQRYLRQHNSQSKRRTRRYSSLEEAAIRRADNGHLSLAVARLLTRRGTVDVGEGGVSWRHDPRLMFTSPHYYSEAQVLAMLEAIKVPVRLLLAEQGLFQRLSTTPVRCAAVQELEVVHLAGGHHLHMEDAATVARVLSGFMDSLPKRSTR